MFPFQSGENFLIDLKFKQSVFSFFLKGSCHYWTCLSSPLHEGNNMTWNQIDWKMWSSSGPACLTGSFSCEAFRFLRYTETKSRIRALTAQPCHLIAAFPPPAAHLSLCQRWCLSRRDGRARCVSPPHIWLRRLQFQLQLPPERVCGSWGISTCSLLQHPAPG